MFPEDAILKLAIVGSRSIQKIELRPYLPERITEIVSGGAKGVDTYAKEYALKNGLPFTEFLPQYEKYGRGAPLRRNLQIISYADMVIAFWDGRSRGTKFVIEQCQKCGKKLIVYKIKNGTPA